METILWKQFEFQIECDSFDFSMCRRNKLKAPTLWSYSLWWRRNYYRRWWFIFPSLLITTTSTLGLLVFDRSWIIVAIIAQQLLPQLWHNHSPFNMAESKDIIMCGWWSFSESWKLATTSRMCLSMEVKEDSSFNN